MESNVILSICISTYNRATKIEKLVREILKCKSKKISVVVTDDKSTDETLEKLGNIKDDRVYLMKNKLNLGARGNWYETINNGNGKYILHLLDRDWLDYRYLDNVVSILESEDIGFGYIGNLYTRYWRINSRNDAVEYYTNKTETTNMFAFSWIHPSGFLIKKDVWNYIKDRNIFSDAKYGIYPHSYIYSLLAGKEKGVVIKYKMITSSVKSNFMNNRSRFYQHENNDLLYWWLPKSWKNEICMSTMYACEMQLWDKRLTQQVIINRFKDALYLATISYRNEAMETEHCMHYNINKEYIAPGSLIKINIKFVADYIKFVVINHYNIADIGFVYKIIKAGIMNLKEILEMG